MKNKKTAAGKLLCLALAGLLCLESMPAAGAEIFQDGVTSEGTGTAASPVSTEADMTGEAGTESSLADAAVPESGTADTGTAVTDIAADTGAAVTDIATDTGTAVTDVAEAAGTEGSGTAVQDVAAETETETIFSSREEKETLWSDGTEAEEAEAAGLTDEEKAAQLFPMENLQPVSIVEAPEMEDPGISGYIRSYSGTVSALPSVYDTRGVLTTEVKNQEPYGMCWAFTTAAGLESSLLQNGQGACDLSEEHLAYFFANRQDDPLGNTANDKNVVAETGEDGVFSYREGGNQIFATIFLSTWSGMGLESEVPYATDSTHTAQYSTTPDVSLAYRTTAYLTEAVYSDYTVSRIKELIYQYGAVGMSFWMDSNYYNVETYAYSYPVSGVGANHAVTLVGWDDSYSCSNFAGSSGVKANGAWIAKNSWGSSWGDGGYFYISYENQSNYNLVAEAGTTSPAYPNNYFYDGSSSLSSLTLRPSSGTGTTSIANVFTATAGMGKEEILGEVVVASHSENNLYGIQIYTNLTDPDDPTSGIPAYSSPVTFYQAYAGISTVTVPEVRLIQGTLYSVVITNEGTGDIDFLCEVEDNYGWVSFQAGISPGQSFARRTGSGSGWSDLYASDMCLRIKAHTRTASAAASLSAPSGVKASGTAYNRVRVSWQPVSGASGYIIYRKKSGGKYTKLAAVDYDVTSYTDKTAKLGTKYTYRIRAYSVVNGSRMYSSYSKTVSARPKLTAPAVSVKVSSNMYNRVTWTKISGAYGYRIYRKTAGGKWKSIAEVGRGTLSYKDRDISAAAVYEYAVRAYRTVDGERVFGSYESSGRYKAAPARQAVSSVTGTGTGIKLRWKAQKNCDGYYIYRKTGSGKWQQIAKLTGGTARVYVDRQVTKGKTYTYYVRAYVEEPYGIVRGKYTVSRKIKRQ